MTNTKSTIKKKEKANYSDLEYEICNCDYLWSSSREAHEQGCAYIEYCEEEDE